MERSVHQLYEFVLRQCAAAEPQPWYPAACQPLNGFTRRQLDQALDDLRLGGLVRLTEWVQGRGQGYALTPIGSQIVQSPAALVKLALVQPNYDRSDDPDHASSADGDWTTLERGDRVRDALTYRSTPWMTWLLILANVAVFLAGVYLTWMQNADLKEFLTAGNGRILRQTGAYNGVGLVSGRWWLLLTTCFVHGGLLHIGLNMLALYSLGRFAERMFGPFSFVVLYLLSGLAGSIAGAIANPLGGCIGASGAICGILAAHAAWVWLNRQFLPPALFRQWLRSLRNAAVMILLISVMPGISAAGHFGGAVMGLAAGGALSEIRYGKQGRRLLAAVGLLGLFGLSAAAVPIAQVIDRRWGDVVSRYERKAWVEEYLPRLSALLRSAEDDWNGNVVPIISKQGEEADKEPLVAARTAAERTRSTLQEALALLEEEASGDQDLERERQDMKRAVRSELDEIEVKEYVRLIYPQQNQAVRSALKTFRMKVRPLLVSPVKTRDKEKVGNTVLEIQEEKGSLAEAAAILHGLRGFDSEPVRKSCEAISAMNQVLDDALKLGLDGLEKPNAWIPENQHRLETEEQRIEALESEIALSDKELKAALNGFRR